MKSRCLRVGVWWMWVRTWCPTELNWKRKMNARIPHSEDPSPIFSLHPIDHLFIIATFECITHGKKINDKNQFQRDRSITVDRHIIWSQPKEKSTNPFTHSSPHLLYLLLVLSSFSRWVLYYSNRFYVPVFLLCIIDFSVSRIFIPVKMG